MVERIQAEMATSIALDTIKATNSLKGLTDAVKATTGAWKAQESAMRSSGDYVQASKARYEGLGQTIDAQKNKISELKQRQEGLDQTTKSGAESFLKYEKDIQKASVQLANLESQQQRAKSSMEYQTSGLAKLQQEYKQLSSVSGSYVDRLKAEGKEQQANIAQANALKSSIGNLSEQYAKQVSELKRIQSESGNTSEAYRKQVTRVNDTATNVANLRSEFKQTQREINSANPYGFGIFSKGASDTYQATVKMGDGFHAATQKVKDFAYSGGIAVAALGALSAKGVEIATNLEDSFVKTSNLAITGGEKSAEVAKNVAQMQKDGAQLSVEYGKSQQEIADGYQDLIKRGYTTTAALGAMRSEVEASVASGDDFNNVVTVSSQVLEAFNLRTNDTAKMTKNTKDVVNQLAYASDLTATDFKDMGKGMEYVGDSAHNAGISLSETSSAMGLLSNHGIEADKAGTGLRKVLNSITGALADQQAAQAGAAESADELNSKIATQKKKLEEAQDSLAKANSMDQSTTKNKNKAAKAIEKATKATTKQQDAVDKLEGKVQGIQAVDMLDKLGISRDKLVDSNGNLRDLTSIMKEVDDKTKNMGTADKAVVFNSLFGTTGQQAGLVLAQFNDELGDLNEKVKKSADGQGYVKTLAEKNMDTTKAKLSQLKSSMEAVSASLGAALLPSISDFSEKLAKALNSKEGQENLKEIAKKAGEVGHNIVDTTVFMSHHLEEIKTFSKVIVGMWAVNKVGGFVGQLKNAVNAMTELKSATMEYQAVESATGLAGGVKSGTVAKNATSAVANTGATVATDTATSIGSRVAGDGGAMVTAGSSKTGIVTKALAGTAAKYAGAIGVAFTAADLGGSIVKAVSTNDTQSKVKASGQAIGTGLGATAGAVLGSVVPGIGTGIGASLGASIGNELGKSGWAQDALNKAFHGTKIEPQKVTYKDSFDTLTKETKKYYDDKAKQDKADIDLLKKNGMITDEEYNNRLDAIKKESEQSKKFEQLSQKDKTAITKYYQQQRSDIEESYSKKKKTARDKWDKKILDDEHTFGVNSATVQQERHKKSEALAKIDSEKKKEINKLTVKTVTDTTVEEAKQHTTLDGKIQLSNDKQKKSYDDLTKNIKHMSDSQVEKVTKNAKSEYDAVKKYSDSQYNTSVKNAEKTYQDNTGAAKRQFEDKKKTADKEHDAVVAAAKKQYSDSSEYSKQQRKTIIEQADKQRDDKVRSASDEYLGVLDKANKEKSDTITAAKKKKEDTQKHAKEQRDKITGYAEDQHVNVVKSSDKQNDEVSKGWETFWSGMKGKASTGLTGVMDPINVGIGAINSLIHAFGGSKNAIPKVTSKFATGTGMFSNTRRPINELTLAMLNDGTDSPETGNREMLIHPNGKSELVHGQNVMRTLLPGTEVLNARETAMLLGQKKMTRFADGTGFFTGIWDSIKDETEKFTKMFSFITDTVANPVESLEKTFNPKLSKDMGAVFNGLGDDVFIKESKKQAGDWWKELWSMASDSASSNGVSGTDDYSFKNKAKDSGADPWGYFYRECVSFVANRLKNSGVNASLFSNLGNGADWVNAKVSHSKTPKAGDVAVYGAGSEFGNHVAMVDKVTGNTIAGEEYNWDGDGKYHQYSGRKASGATTFLDFGLSGKSNSDDKTENHSPLQSLIKSEVGGMFDWIKKFIAPTNDTSTAGSDVQSWSGDVKKALKSLGLSTDSSMVNKVLRQIQTESGGNEKAVQHGYTDSNTGGNEARGLMQVTPSTWNAYARPGQKWDNGADSIDVGLRYAMNRYGRDLSALGNGIGYANGTITNVPHMANIAEGGKTEAVIPWDLSKKSRAMELLGETVTHFAKNSTESNNHVSVANSTDNTILENKLATMIEQGQQMINYLSQLLVAQSDTKIAVYDKSEMYKQQAQDGNMRGYQSLG